MQDQLTIKRDRCPYCHDEIVPGDSNFPCLACLAWHHGECLKEHGSCVTCGHKTEGKTLEPTTRPAWVNHGCGVESIIPSAYCDEKPVTRGIVLVDPPEGVKITPLDEVELRAVEKAGAVIGYTAVIYGGMFVIGVALGIVFSMLHKVLL
ncbi:MAG: hypothetical protein AB7L09_01800 [Nitrospira sp.]